MSRPGISPRGLALLFTLVLALAPVGAQARIGFGHSFGSRGMRTFSMPHYTPLAPGGGAAIERSMTGRSSIGSGFSRPGYAGGGLFGSGMGRGFIGGLLGAGLFGLLFGRGLFGGVGGIGSLFGLVVQIAIVIFLARLAMRWFASRQMGVQGAGGGTGYGSPYQAGGYGVGAGAPSQPLSLTSDDFNQFERILHESQTAFGAEDLDRLRLIATPEMASYFAEQIADNARRGLVNKIGDVRLLKGDLSEAWSEGLADFATVAMRFSLLDWTIERASGSLVDGDPARPQIVTEVWTFRRDRQVGADGWRVSAIQQA